MNTKKYGRNFNPNLKIERSLDGELDFAIEELEKRGFELVNRGYDVNDASKFNYDQTTRYVSKGSVGVRGKYWACLKKIEVSVQ